MDCNAGGSEKTDARSGVSLRVISNGCELLDPSIRLLGGIFDKAITGSLFSFLGAERNAANSVTLRSDTSTSARMKSPNL